LALLKAVNFNCILTEQIIKGENINKCDFMKIISVATETCKKYLVTNFLLYISYKTTLFKNIIPWLELDYVLNANFHFIDIYIEILTQLFIHIFF
jgi:hypothetical protein